MLSRHMHLGLIESDGGPHRAGGAGGFLFSVITHSAVVIAVVAVTAQAGFDMSDADENVRYLIPFDRILRPPDSAPREPLIPLLWGVGNGTGGGNGGQILVELDSAGNGRRDAPGRGRRSGGNALDVPFVVNLLDGDTVRTEIEVDSIVERSAESEAPAYPPALLERNVEGEVRVQFVVDTTGRIDPRSFRVLEATHVEFADAIRAVVPGMKFKPASMARRRVPQLVEQPFFFRIERTRSTPAVAQGAVAQPR